MIFSLVDNAAINIKLFNKVSKLLLLRVDIIAALAFQMLELGV